MNLSPGPVDHPCNNTSGIAPVNTLGHAEEVTPEPVPELEPSSTARRFQSLFGVTEEELTKQGIDPTKYAQDHIRDMMKHRQNWNELLPPSGQYNLLRYRVLGWGWGALFAALGLVVLFKILGREPIGLWLGAVMLAVAIVLWAMSLHYQSLCKQACNHEGIDPPWWKFQPWHRSR
jgi:hypothetical protein